MIISFSEVYGPRVAIGRGPIEHKVPRHVYMWLMQEAVRAGLSYFMQTGLMVKCDAKWRHYEQGVR